MGFGAVETLVLTIAASGRRSAVRCGCTSLGTLARDVI